MITQRYTRSGFAFVVITSDEPEYSNPDDQDHEPIVQIFDLERHDEPLPSEPAIRGHLLSTYYRDSLVFFAGQGLDLILDDLVVPASCIQDVAEFLREW